MSERTPNHKRHRDWEPFDAIRIALVPRYKTSDLSGDEWRVGAKVELLFKGVVVAENFYRDVETAVRYLPAFMSEASCPIPDEVIKMEDAGFCDQPSCPEKSVARYWLKEEFGAQGEKLHPDQYAYHRSYRQFCRTHLQRGDCGHEDADRNYEPAGEVGPGDAAGWERYAKEAARATVEVGSIEEIPAAVERARKEFGR